MQVPQSTLALNTAAREILSSDTGDDLHMSVRKECWPHDVITVRKNKLSATADAPALLL